MIKYYKYRKRPKRFLALTGYKVEEFDELVPEFANSLLARKSDGTS